MKEQRNIKAFDCEITDIAEHVIITPFLSIKKIADNFDSIEKSFNGFYFYKGITGSYNGERITLISTAVGPTSVGDAVLFLKDCPQIKSVLFAGSVGALKEDAALGEVYTVKEAISGGSFENYLELSMDDLEKYLSGRRHRGRFSEQASVPEIKEIKVLSIASLAFETPENLKKLQELGIEGLDLETAAFYAACNKINVPASALLFVADLPLKQSLFAGLVKKDQKLMPHIIEHFQRLILNI